MNSNWKLVDVMPPEINIEVLGFAKEWIDEDFNPDGIRVCYLQDLDEEPTWESAAWCNNCDEWHTISTDDLDPNGNLFNPDKNVAPTHWIEKPVNPILEQLNVSV